MFPNDRVQARGDVGQCFVPAHGDELPASLRAHAAQWVGEPVVMIRPLQVAIYLRAQEALRDRMFRVTLNTDGLSVLHRGDDGARVRAVMWTCAANGPVPGRARVDQGKSGAHGSRKITLSPLGTLSQCWMVKNCDTICSCPLPRPSMPLRRLSHVARASRIRVLFTVAVISLGMVPGSAQSQQRGVAPDSLTSAEFWAFFTSMSEPDGYFLSENFVSNEVSFQEVIPTLQKSLTKDGVYLGVGPEQNFTYISNLSPRLAVIFDIRRQNAMQHLLYKA